ncbi:transcription antitermination factor NusB [bacterium]|nr:transcription antitermination factor NusB [bacterium]
MLPRRKARILALCMLYAMDMQKTNDTSEGERIEDFFVRPFRDREKIFEYALFLTRGVVRNLDAIDGLINHHTYHWDRERIAMVDMEIMRIAVYEFAIDDRERRAAFHERMEKIPPVVAINEAIEIAKIYCSGDSGHFVNGILDAVNAELKGQERESQPDPRKLKKDDPDGQPAKEEKKRSKQSAKYLEKFAQEEEDRLARKEAQRAEEEAKRAAEWKEKKEQREKEWEEGREQREKEREEQKELDRLFHD